MITKKYRTDLGTHSHTNSKEEKIKYTWESLKKLYKEGNLRRVAF